MVHPFLYEVNARQWISELRRVHGLGVDLGTVPEAELMRLKGYGVTHLWLMGVWPTGEISRAEAIGDAGLREAYGMALAGWSGGDVEGSPYAVADYRVSERLGGEGALAALRERLSGLGIRLILDFVPNHVGRDHVWVKLHPEWFVGADHPFEGSFAVDTAVGRRYLAHGKDPYFPGWTDTVQVDYRNPGAREAMFKLLEDVASGCDGVRCDMAMLVLSEVFERTWAHVPHLGGEMAWEFWEEATSLVRSRHPGFLFLAEAYWGLEGRLCGMGFDFAYDKVLYDRVVHGRGDEVTGHLVGMGVENERRAHFLENHDEPRIASLIDAPRLRAGLVVCLGLPGMRFLHDGQVEGRRVFARVQLSRRCDEEEDVCVRVMHEEVLAALVGSRVGRGTGRVLDPFAAWDGNPTCRYVVAVIWGEDAERDLVVVNLAPHRVQCRVHLGLERGGSWVLRDRLGPEEWERDGNELEDAGLFLDLVGYAAQIFEVRRG